MEKGVKRSSIRLNFFEDEEFDFQLIRAMGAHYHGGASIGECLNTASRIKSGNTRSWAEEWAATAALVQSQAEEFLQNGQNVSAREAFLRASMYYRSAEYYGFFSEPDRRENWENSRKCFRNAGSLLDTPFETIDIPFEDMLLPGYFMRPSDDGKRRPTLLIMGGFDSTGEELYFQAGAGTISRDYNALIFEGPGQAGPIHLYPDKPFRPDYEAPVSAAVDYALSRSEVDKDRLALIGFSLGGYFASRAIVYEKRIKACIPNSPIRDVYGYFSGFIEMLGQIEPSEYDAVFKKFPMARWAVETFTRRFGEKTISDVLERMKDFNILGLEKDITCPTLTLIGEGEGPEALDQAQRFYERVADPKSMHIFTVQEGAESHCQVSNLGLMNAVVFDWLDEILGVQK
jgi:pimeloyl-ACP methyl ester carboxylesterase